MENPCSALPRVGAQCCMVKSKRTEGGGGRGENACIQQWDERCNKGAAELPSRATKVTGGRNCMSPTMEPVTM